MGEVGHTGVKHLGNIPRCVLLGVVPGPQGEGGAMKGHDVGVGVIVRVC